ncbi:MAG: GldM family protein, partial [Bacteroidales bacterium]|nr:GldM family protein [Bacteroidales bacterium]
TSSLGDKPWGGLINMKAPDGTVVSYPFDASYTVGEPNVVVSPTAMNVLYAGIPNPIDISVPGVGSDAISATMANGNIKRGRLSGYRGEWIASPTKVGQEASVNVSAVVNGERRRFPPYKFRVKSIPPPITQFAQKTSDSPVPKAVLLAQPGVFAVQPDFLFDLKFTVTKFTVTVVKGGFDRIVSSPSARITADQRTLIDGLSRGQKLYLTDVWAIGPDKKQVKINSLIITVQ